LPITPGFVYASGMKYKTLGRSGLRVSSLCLGTMNFGTHASREDSFQVMDKALDLGIQFFDTANVYGGGDNRGLTEEIIGEWLSQGGGRREAIVLATKVYGPMENRMAIGEYNKGGRMLSKYKIINHCEDSLRRLKTERIDLYQMHHIDRDCPHDEYWEAFEILQNQGKVLYVGSSNFAGWDIAESCMTAKRRNNAGLVSEQSKYSLVTRNLELEVLPACERFGVGVIPYSPLERGILGGALKKVKTGRRAMEGQQESIKKFRPQIERWEALCQEMGVAPAKVALAWLLTRPAVVAPIIGPRTLEQLEDLADVPEIELEDQVLEKIDSIWPGYGEAPGHYAW